MFCYISQHSCPTNFLIILIKHLAIIILIFSVFLVQEAKAQNLALHDTTITTRATFSAESITIGPNFTVANTGDVILSAKTIAVIPKFFVVQGGKLQFVSGSPYNVETEYPIIQNEFIVHQNYPNPFNPVTFINYELRIKSYVKLTVYDLAGREIETLVNHQQNAGQYSVTFEAFGLSSGIYIYKIKAGLSEQSHKMVLLR